MNNRRSLGSFAIAHEGRNPALFRKNGCIEYAPLGRYSAPIFLKIPRLLNHFQLLPTFASSLRCKKLKDDLDHCNIMCFRLNVTIVLTQHLDLTIR